MRPASTPSAQNSRRFPVASAGEANVAAALPTTTTPTNNQNRPAKSTFAPGWSFADSARKVSPVVTSARANHSSMTSRAFNVSTARIAVTARLDATIACTMNSGCERSAASERADPTTSSPSPTTYGWSEAAGSSAWRPGRPPGPHCAHRWLAARSPPRRRPRRRTRRPAPASQPSTRRRPPHLSRMITPGACCASPPGKGLTMRSIWKGAISFGLVTIPVKLYSRDRGEGRLLPPGAPRATAAGSATSGSARSTARRSPYTDIAKGYELPSGEIVVLTDEDFADLPLTTPRRSTCCEFVPARAGRPDLLRQELLPRARRGRRQALRPAARRAGGVRPGRRSSRSRCGSASRWRRCGCATASSCSRPCSGRTRSARPSSASSTRTSTCGRRSCRWPQSLIDTLSGDFDPSEYNDNYREALQEVIEAKVAGREVVAAGAAASRQPAPSST